MQHRLTSFDLNAIDEPLKLHVGVIDGLQAALQMAPLALLQVVHTEGDTDRHSLTSILLNRLTKVWIVKDLLAVGD